MDPRPSATPAPPTPIEASAPPFPDPQAASQQAIAQEHDAQSVIVDPHGEFDDDDDDGDDDETHTDVVKATPPWLISLIFHMVLLIVMGLLFLPSVAPRVLQLDAQFAEEIGDQLDEESIRVALDEEESLEQIMTPEDLVPVDDPLVAPADIAIDPLGVNVSSDLAVPDIGVALTGRQPGMKQALLAAYGGTETTEQAVERGLQWLKRNQLRDGSWSLAGPYSDGALNENPTAATAMALLAFLGAGHTHQSGEHKEVVKRGFDALLKMQDANGDFFRGNVAHHRLYSQAQAMIAICELWGMTKDSRFRDPAQKSVDYAVKTQGALGGWRYQPGADSDTSVTGWFVMGLQSAMMGGLDVPSDTLERIKSFLDRVAAADGARYGYQPGNEPTYPMTAEGLLCRQYLGWKHEDPRLQNGVKLISMDPIDMNRRNVYYWYYATQVMHHMGGDVWDSWNRVMRQEIPEAQTREGPEAGSWSPTGDQWGPHGGRLYVTCLSIYMLEVYYRHLPIYQY